MARFTRQTAAVAALLAALFAGGCATTVAGTPSADPRPQPSSGPGADPAAWADRVCGALVTYWRPMTPAAVPNFAEFNPKPGISAGEAQTLNNGIKQRLSEYLGSVTTAIDQGQQQLREAGPAPVSGGDGLVRSYADAMSANRKIITDAKAEIDSVDAANSEAFRQKLDAADAKLKTFVAPQGLDKLGNTPRLVKAIERAPKCGEYRSITQPPPP